MSENESSSKVLIIRLVVPVVGIMVDPIRTVSDLSTELEYLTGREVILENLLWTRSLKLPAKLELDILLKLAS